MWDHHMWGLLLSRLRTPHLLPQPHSLACWVESQISKSLNFAVCSKFVLCYFHIRDKTWHRLCITKPKCTAWRQGSRRKFSPFLPRVNIAARGPFVSIQRVNISWQKAYKSRPGEQRCSQWRGKRKILSLAVLTWWISPEKRLRYVVATRVDARSGDWGKRKKWPHLSRPSVRRSRNDLGLSEVVSDGDRAAGRERETEKVQERNWMWFFHLPMMLQLFWRKEKGETFAFCGGFNENGDIIKQSFDIKYIAR